LGILVSQSTVAKFMRRPRRPPSQTWRTFLTNQACQIMAADLFVVPTVTFRLLFVLVIFAHERRRIVHFAVTDHPTAAWTAQQLRNALCRERRAEVSPALPRFGVCRRGNQHRGDEYSGCSYGAAIALAGTGRRRTNPGPALRRRQPLSTFSRWRFWEPPPLRGSSADNSNRGCDLHDQCFGTRSEFEVTWEQ
jgi:hypothetical protein